MFALTFGYVVARFLSNFARKRKDAVTAIAMDGLAFSSYVLILLATVFPHTILPAMGDPGPFLDLAGVLGVLGCVDGIPAMRF